MNQQNLAPFSVWSSVQKYVTGDLVVYSTAIWQASTTSQGNTPTSTSTAWTLQLGGGGGAPGGSNTQIQFNSSGTFAGDAQLFFHSGNGNLINFMTSSVNDLQAVTFRVSGSLDEPASMYMHSDAGRTGADWELKNGNNRSMLYIDNITPSFDVGDPVFSVPTQLFGSLVRIRVTDLFMPNLPTTAPAGSKQVWISSGVLAITA